MLLTKVLKTLYALDDIYLYIFKINWSAGLIIVKAQGQLTSLWKLSGPVHPLIFSTWGYYDASFCGTSIPFSVSLNIYFFVRYSAIFLKLYMEAFMTPVLGPFMSLTFLFSNGILSFWRIGHGLYLCGTLLPQLDKKKKKTLHEVWRGQLWQTIHPSFTDKWRCPSPIYHKIPRNRGKRLCLIFWMIVAVFFFFIILEGFFGDGVRCFLAHKWAYTLMLSLCACVCVC